MDPPQPAISISPASVSLASIEETATFTARITDQYGAEYSGTVTWASEDTEVFTVNATGQVTAAGTGTGTVRASFQQLSATAQVTVRQEVAAITVSPPLDTLVAVGDTVTLTAVAADANEYPIQDTEFAWASSAPRVVTVDADGVVTAVGEGRATISATAGV